MPSDFDREVSIVIAALVAGEQVDVRPEVMDAVRARMYATIVHPPMVIYEVIRGSGIFSSAGWPENDRGTTHE